MRYLSIRSMWCEYHKKSKPTTKSDKNFNKNLKLNAERKKLF